MPDWRFWAPLPDSHVPPAPFGGHYKRTPDTRKHADRDVIAKFPQSEWCLQNPVAETAPAPHPTACTLRVTDEIVCKDGHGAQILLYHLDQDYEKVYVAKIYDPLYYPFVDKEFNQEAAAYEELRKAGVDGLLVPKYYGSWMINIALENPNVLRPVRMILMEWIQGVSMQSLITANVSWFSSAQRLSIFARAMEVEAKVRFHGVYHKDFAPRNVLLVGPSPETQTPRVFLIDFNQSLVFSQPHAQFCNYKSTKPISPRCLYWGQCPDEFWHWLPEPHRSKDPVFNEWLKSTWSQLKDFEEPEDMLKRLEEDNEADSSDEEESD
ncbi:hypothetical protein PT974_03582 [Cladobotryum mycophilum]|uniref:EKC/KEOPS complex subunit BUD32 n=1 Tax=Cladobotryum mycophilum TaxID=491253 RepID=A0ABR0SSP4_9HYPO